MIAFVRPWMLLALLALPWWWWRRGRRRPVAAQVSETAPFREANRGRWRLWIPPVLRSLACAALLLAAAGPYRRGDRITVNASGVTIILAIDVSSSMLAEDFTPANRLEVAKRQAIAFIRGRTADRIGLVVFAGEALTMVPATLDYATLERTIAALEVGHLEDGTAIGAGLATAVRRVHRMPGKEKVIVLLSDGENNRGIIDPRTAGQTAQAYGIKVYTIGVGTEGEARVPTGKGLNGFRYEMLPVRIDEKLLTEIAEATGGRYFRARDAGALGRIFTQIDRLEKTKVETIRYAQQDERTRPFLLGALVLLTLELAVGARLVVRVP